MLTVLEQCQISPPPNNTLGEKSLQLTFLDILFLRTHPIHNLFFYNFPHSKNHFIQQIIPNLKNSLSITLQHFFPFTSNLILFPSSSHDDVIPKTPEIRYADGDSVVVTFAECDHDFDDLKGNHPRDCNKFSILVPMLGNGEKVSDTDDEFFKIPIFAVQVTFFVEKGIAIGVTNHHALCDAFPMYDFLKAWTSIAKSGTDELFLADGSFPVYDRVIKYPKYFDEVYLKRLHVGSLAKQYEPSRLSNHEDKVRATIVLNRTHVNSLKKWVVTKLPNLEHVTTFSVTCAHIWSCISKSSNSTRETNDDDLEMFVCPMNLRTRLNDPQIPDSYFGNCVGLITATTKSSLLSGSDGYLTAVEVLGNALNDAIKKKDGLLKDADKWPEKFSKRLPSIGVGGTPKLKMYDLDFGWGKPKKYEDISIDYSTEISVNVTTESREDIEIGVSFTAKQMNALLTISKNELLKTKIYEEASIHEL